MAREDVRHPVNGSMFDTEHACAGVVIGSLILLWAIRRGFRGLGAPGVGSISIGG